MVASTLLKQLLPLANRNILMPSPTLLDRLLRNERSAQTDFYNQYAGKMFSLTLRYVSSRQDAQEIVNTSFLTAIRSIESYKAIGSLEGWLRTIVKRAAIDHCRKYIYKIPSKSEILEHDSKVYNNALDELNAQDFLSVIQKVPNASRVVFNMFAIEGYSHKEIAKELNISEGTSKWHVSKARKVLIEQLKSQGYGY